MDTSTFQALVVREEANGSFSKALEQLSLTALPDHDVLVKVSYTALNYKDALSASGHKGVTRTYPHTPGIDATGWVAESRHPGFQPGDPVIITGFDLGMNTSGGFAEYVRVPSGWLVPLPAGLSLREATVLGTAGFTAGLALMQMLRSGQKPENGPVLVTGATGGVGSMAVAILKKAGFEVIAATGKPEARAFLEQIGADQVIDRNSILPEKDRPLLTGRWAGVIDTVGGPILSAAIRACLPYGNVAICGLVSSPEFAANVYPFILRGVNLLGIESAECPMPLRWQVWQKLSRFWKPHDLESMSIHAELPEVFDWINRILEGKVTGRVVFSIHPPEHT